MIFWLKCRGIIVDSIDQVSRKLNRTKTHSTLPAWSAISPHSTWPLLSALSFSSSFSSSTLFSAAQSGTRLTGRTHTLVTVGLPHCGHHHQNTSLLYLFKQPQKFLQQVELRPFNLDHWRSFLSWLAESVMFHLYWPSVAAVALFVIMVIFLLLRYSDSLSRVCCGGEKQPRKGSAMELVAYEQNVKLEHAVWV